MQISRLAAHFPAKKYRLAKNFRQPQLVKKVFLTSWWPGEQAIHNSQWSFRCARRARLRPSLAYWAYFALLRSSIRNSHLATLPLASLPPLSSAWSSHTFAPPCANACAVFRGCALRFAPCARHFSPSGLRCSQAHSRLSLLHWAHRRLLHPQFAMVVLLRPTACSTPLLIGLTTACFAHCARPSCAPPAAPPLSPSLGLLRAASPTGRALRAPPLHKGAFWKVAPPQEVALPKSLLFPEGKREVARRSRDGGIGRWHGVSRGGGI